MDLGLDLLWQYSRTQSHLQNLTTPTNTILIDDNKSEDSRTITVHSSDTTYTQSDTQILLKEPILYNENDTTIETDGEQAFVANTRSRSQTKNELNSGVRTRSMVAESSTGLFTPAGVKKYSFKFY